MATQFDTDAQPNMTQLLSGILDDARQLFVQQLTLFQVELKNDLRRSMQIMLAFIAGASVCFVAVIILAIALAHLLCHVWSDLPLWGGFGIVGLILTAGGVGLLAWGKAKYDSSNLLPNETVQGLKENIQWKTKP